MFGEQGYEYIYFTYGMYFCFNVTSAPKGVGEGILIRALEPVEGIELMIKRRTQNQKPQKYLIENLCNGPAKLVLAMGINKDHYGHDLTESPLYIAESDSKITQDFEIVTTNRIGISQAKDLPLRFYIKDNKFISKK